MPGRSLDPGYILIVKSFKLQASTRQGTSGKPKAAAGRSRKPQAGLDNAVALGYSGSLTINERYIMSFDSTIKLVKKQRDVLVDVIQWLDEKNFSNSEIRSKVDVILNHSRKLNEGSDMELTKIKLI